MPAIKSRGYKSRYSQEKTDVVVLGYESLGSFSLLIKKILFYVSIIYSIKVVNVLHKQVVFILTA